MSSQIHIDGVEYKYKTHKWGVNVFLPTGRVYFDYFKVIGWTSENIGRSRDKRSGVQVKPNDIKRCVIKHLQDNI